MFCITVPNHLDVEDTFGFGLTMRQCLLLFIGAVMSYLLFLNLLTAIADARLAVLGSATAAVLLFTGVLLVVFLRLGNRPMEEWGLICLLYVSRPRLHLWQFHHLDAWQVRQHARSRRMRERQAQEEEQWA